MRRSEQARKVGAYLTGGGSQAVLLNVMNISAFGVYRFEAVAIVEADGDSGENDRWCASFFPTRTTMIIEPGTYPPVQVEPPSPNLNFRHEIAFTDDNGVRWHKYGPAGLHEVAADFTLLGDMIQWEPKVPPDMSRAHREPRPKLQRCELLDDVLHALMEQMGDGLQYEHL